MRLEKRKIKKGSFQSLVRGWPLLGLNSVLVRLAVLLTSHLESTRAAVRWKPKLSSSLEHPVEPFLVDVFFSFLRIFLEPKPKPRPCFVTSSKFVKKKVTAK